MRIAPAMIVCGDRYTQCAKVSLASFLRSNRFDIYVIADLRAFQQLKFMKKGHIKLIHIEEYEKYAKKMVNIDKFAVFKYDKYGMHKRIYSSLKPIIMDRVISDFVPSCECVLSLDSDTLFSGNIMDRVIKYLHPNKDIYMVERKDKRMLQTGSQEPGSGFTMWRRKGKFIKYFIKNFKLQYAGFKGGGSQNLINLLMGKLPASLIKDPLLHFVSPDLKNSNITDREIEKIKPAYIHLHGKDSVDRLKRFYRIFYGNN